MGRTVQDMEEAIDGVLHRNAAYAHLFSSPRTPLEELLAGEGMENIDEETRMAVRLETFRALMEFFFQSGPDPLAVLRHVFALGKAVSPHLMGDMSMDDIAIICADGGKATVSARIQRIYSKTLEDAGMSGKASCQKTSEKYRTSQLGNNNRVKGREMPNRKGKRAA